MTTKDSNNAPSLIDETERLFVRKKYGKSHKLASQILQLSLGTITEPEKNDKVMTVKTVPFRRDGTIVVENPCVVHGSNDVTTEDRAAVIVLQCCYEIMSKKRQGQEELLDPFFKHYWTNPISMQVMVVFIRFCYANGFTHTAVEMASEILHKEDVDELWIFVLLTALPYASNPKHVVQVLDSINKEEWISLEDKFEASSKPNHKAVSTILDKWDELSISNQDVSHKCEQDLISLLNTLESLKETVSNNRGLVDKQLVPSNSVRHDSSTSSWEARVATICRRWAKRIMRFVHQHVRPLVNGDDQWENRAKVVIAFVVGYISWRRRQRLKSATYTVGRIVASPINEIMEALVPER